MKNKWLVTFPCPLATFLSRFHYNQPTHFGDHRRQIKDVQSEIYFAFLSTAHSLKLGNESVIVFVDVSEQWSFYQFGSHFHIYIFP